MSDHYTEQDTERARRVQHSSAGLSTQHLSLPRHDDPLAATPTQDRGGNLVGLLLIAGGVLALASRVFLGVVDIEGGMVLLTIASVFLFFGFWRRIYGLLIPGSLLAGLSVGVPFAELTNGVSVMWGLALGFLAIYALGRGFHNNSSPWPIFPAVIMFAVGALVFITNAGALFAATFIWIPLLLIGIGIYLGWMRTT